MKILSLAFLLCLLGCSTPKNAYESVAPKIAKNFKKVPFPFRPGTSFKVSQGAYGEFSHNEPGNELSWDFDVPYGTEVVAVESGRVIEIWKPQHAAGCSVKFKEFAVNVKIEALDGTVAQYVHLTPVVHMNQKVEQGQPIGVTSENGFICTPQLHFGIYSSRDNLYDAFERRTVPLIFEDVPGGIVRQGQVYKVKSLD